jgi:predicted HicB family RNase H-like nuclease
MTRINIELNEELHKKAKLNALLQNKTLIKYLNEALDEKIKRDNKTK